MSVPFRMAKGLIAVFLFTGLGDGTVHAQGGEPVTLTLNDGRQLTGQIDELTDKSRLWLRFTAPSMTMSMSTSWSEIASIRHGGQTFSPEQFRPRAMELKSKLSDDFFPNYFDGRELASEPRRLQAHRRKKRADHRNKIRTLSIQAEIVNLDSDHAADGLIVRVYPLDSHGELVPINGSLNVRLISQRLRGLVRTQEFPELGRWSQLVRIADFAVEHASFQFPFQRVDPEFDLEFADLRLPWSSQSEPLGQVDARLDVPGQGSFFATVPIQLRSYSPLREELQLREQTRIFSGERVSRGAH